MKCFVINFIICRCRANVIFFIAFWAILAVAIVFCNLMVIIVFLINRKLINAQGVYRLSMVFADLLVGLIVAPTLAYQTFQYYTQNLLQKEFKISSNYSVSEANTHLQTSNFKNIFLSQSYVNFFGFITQMWLISSILTLMLAGVDRFIAVYRPIFYVNFVTIKVTLKFVIGVWLIAGLISLLPIFINTIQYKFYVPIIIVAVGPSTQFFYLIVLCLPLVIMWFITVATLMFYKIHMKTHGYLTNNQKYQEYLKKESRLTFTLGIIVGVFSIFVFPCIIYLLIVSVYQGPIKTSWLNSVGSFGYFTLICLLANSLWNFYVYSIRNKLFKVALKKMFRRFFNT